ncbi:MAG TPA: response regulator [Methylomirabilota bacterium]|jgi:two-component system CheB/CheR fusion protein|nr:response regulator [Methylomirabilota bacterium]
MTPDRPFANLTGSNVLVVENDRDYLELLMTLLTHCGARVASARTVAEARNAASTSAPDVILCDLRLDGDFAVDFLTWLRKQPPPLRDVPAIAMTGFYEDFPRAKAANVAFKAFFRKPVNLERLCETLSALRRGEPVGHEMDRYD